MHEIESLRPEIVFVDRVEDFAPKTEKIGLALEKAIEVHEGQFRKSGEPYVNHCVAVAGILASWGLEQEKHEALYCAALLHDAEEDTNYGLKDIRAGFGDKITELVDGVSKFRSERKIGENEVDRETLRKVVMKTFVDPKVGLLKLADRLHNMRTLEAMPENSRAAKAWETLTVYAPLAESLGMWVVKTEFEDLAFSYIDKEKYNMIRSELDRDARFEQGFIKRTVKDIEDLMDFAGLPGEVSIRAGGYWKSNKKRERAGMRGESGLGSFFDINDVLSLRVKLGNAADCYKFLGVLRQHFGVLVDETRADDFISIAPRDNGYMALQETVGFKEGTVEVAIMTFEMEEFNNWGVVSLLRCGDRELSDYRLKLLFTPAGEVRFLPVEANGIDLAAMLNRSLLAGMIGVKADGRNWGLSESLPNGATIEILTNEDGEEIMAESLLADDLLPRTRRIIGDLLKQKERDRLAESGERLMEKILKKRGLFCLEDILGVNPGWDSKLKSVLFEFGCEDLRDLDYKFGSRALKAAKLEELLDWVGITKTGLGLVSVSLTGVNRKGVLAKVSEMITSVGGDIANLKLIWQGEGRYCLRLVVEGLAKRETELSDLLTRNDWLEKVEVV